MLKRLGQSVGFAALLLALNFGSLLGGGEDVRLHVPFALGGIVAAQIAAIAVLGLLLFGVLAVVRGTRFERWATFALALGAPPLAMVRLQSLMPFVTRHGLMPVLGSGWVALVILLLVRSPLWYGRLLRMGDVVGVFLAVFAVCSVAQLLWVARWTPPDHDRMATSDASSPQTARQHALLVWVVFDELSYDQAFEHRAKSVALPNFDALRNESTVFTDVQPAGYHTAEVLPSLLSGKEVDGLRYTFGNRLLVHDRGERGWQPLDGSGTVFHDARQMGWRTAAVGWYNPYCTVYGEALNTCYWTNLDEMAGMMSLRGKWYRNAVVSLRDMVVGTAAPHHADRTSCDFDVQQRLATEMDLEQHAMQVLRTDQADFVFLHMPIPHSPNVWSRSKGAYTDRCGSSYLDSLALADRVLGEFVGVLEQSPRWKQTTLVVQGDHSWRVDMWKGLPAWTREDAQASGGVFDPRPALLVHAAGQADARAVSEPWPLLRVHGVLEQVLRGEPVGFSR